MQTEQREKVATKTTFIEIRTEQEFFTWDLMRDADEQSKYPCFRKVVPFFDENEQPHNTLWIDCDPPRPGWFIEPDILCGVFAE